MKPFPYVWFWRPSQMRPINALRKNRAAARELPGRDPKSFERVIEFRRRVGEEFEGLLQGWPKKNGRLPQSLALHHTQRRQIALSR